MRFCRNAHIVVAVFVATAALLLCACKPSDAIVERIYDQSSSNIDYDNPNKIFIPDETAKVTVEDLHFDKKNLPKKEEVKRDLPDTQGKKNAEKVKRVEHDPKSPSKKKAPSNSGKKKGTDTKKAGETGDKKKKKESAPKGNKAGGGTEPGKSPDAETGSHSYDMDDDSYQNRTYDSRYGDTEDLPDDATTVAAIGELATMTQVLGKTGTLVGSSEDYLAQDAIKAVFADKGVKKIKAIWSGDGTKTTGKEVDAIIDLAPDALVVYPGQLTSKQERVIAQNCPETAVITAPQPTSMDNIKAGMSILAKLLKKSTDGQSQDIRKEYDKFVDDVVDEAQDSHGGGVVTYDAIDYNSSDETNPAKASNLSDTDPLWTLYISNWDEDARVTATYQGSTLFTDTGAAYTRTGWAWSPLSYFMSVGGVINNAAAYGSLSTNTVQPVLGINENQVSFKWNDFSVDTDEKRGGGSFTRYRAYHVLMNARDAADSSVASETHPLGSDDFDTVIVKNKSIKDALKEARDEEDGLYTMYESATTGQTTGYGRVVNGKEGKSIVWTTVKGDAGYKILVNPCGYVGSWTDGSLESPLEALWVASEFHGHPVSSLEEKIEEFYDTFYGYDVSSKTSKIISGAYAEE